MASSGSLSNHDLSGSPCVSFLITIQAYAGRGFAGLNWEIDLPKTVLKSFSVQMIGSNDWCAFLVLNAAFSSSLASGMSWMPNFRSRLCSYVLSKLVSKCRCSSSASSSARIFFDSSLSAAAQLSIARFRNSSASSLSASAIISCTTCLASMPSSSALSAAANRLSIVNAPRMYPSSASSVPSAEVNETIQPQIITSAANTHIILRMPGTANNRLMDFPSCTWQLVSLPQVLRFLHLCLPLFGHEIQILLPILSIKPVTNAIVCNHVTKGQPYCHIFRM